MNKKIVSEAGFDKEISRIEKYLCPFCGDAIKIEDFRDKISRKEYNISGLCQKCQDQIFYDDDE